MSVTVFPDEVLLLILADLLPIDVVSKRFNELTKDSRLWGDVYSNTPLPVTPKHQVHPREAKDNIVKSYTLDRYLRNEMSRGPQPLVTSLVGEVHHGQRIEGYQVIWERYLLLMKSDVIRCYDLDGLVPGKTEPICETQLPPGTLYSSILSPHKINSNGIINGYLYFGVPTKTSIFLMPHLTSSPPCIEFDIEIGQGAQYHTLATGHGYILYTAVGTNALYLFSFITREVYKLQHISDASIFLTFEITPRHVIGGGYFGHLTTRIYAWVLPHLMTIPLPPLLPQKHTEIRKESYSFQVVHWYLSDYSKVIFILTSPASDVYTTEGDEPAFLAVYGAKIIDEADKIEIERLTEGLLSTSSYSLTITSMASGFANLYLMSTRTMNPTLFVFRLEPGGGDTALDNQTDWKMTLIKEVQFRLDAQGMVDFFCDPYKGRMYWPLADSSILKLDILDVLDE
ncbi:hypothetical protein PC9H_007928 [Pleurotus ostreatus]|uniref:F-box domain-containing protein n=1 Tax=Pleurotus ostreatus TaxID=5322 RepID=A0A8H6ZV29_PLEOS|nr:uncharacterized protein PC9H_007928 [Pleurotus ostreatus]KAF7428699.1 hypothetical protein PC9H_007928 [Pleurotus ostreatus]